MTVVASDTFTAGGSGTQPLTTYSASWTINGGAFTQDKHTDYAYADDNAECGAHWNADSFNDDQYATVVMGVATAAGWMGPGVRLSATGQNWYGFYGNSVGSNVNAIKVVSGSWTQLGSAGSTGFSGGDTLTLEVSGTTLSPKLNGSAYSDIGDQTDSSLSSGYAGIVGYGQSSPVNTNADTWEGGNLSTLTDYTLTAAAGAIDLTGVAASLLHDRVLPAGAGSVVVTGAAAATIYDRLVSAGLGSIQFNPTVAGLIYARIMPAEGGAVQIVGADATLSHGYTLAADPAALALAGAAAGLVYDRRIAAEIGAVQLTGADASLLLAYTLAADAAALNLAAAAAGLVYDRVIAADAGNLVITGYDATLTYTVPSAYTLVAEAGAMIITGTGASFLRDYALAAGLGEVVIIGVDAGLDYTIPGAGEPAGDWGPRTREEVRRHFPNRVIGEVESRSARMAREFNERMQARLEAEHQEMIRQETLDQMQAQAAAEVEAEKQAVLRRLNRKKTAVVNLQVAKLTRQEEMVRQHNREAEIRRKRLAALKKARRAKARKNAK
jgi:hypothetical protein